MVKLQIVISRPHKTIIFMLPKNPHVINRAVYNYLTDINIDVETAIECACFCELAAIGGSYNTDLFDVYIELERKEEVFER